MVHVIVGPQKEELLIHEHLLLEASSVICELCDWEVSKEAEPWIVRMSKEDPKTFSFAIDWLYKAQGRQFEAIDWHAGAPPLSIYLRLWMFGSRWGMIELQNFVMRQLDALRKENCRGAVLGA